MLSIKRSGRVILFVLALLFLLSSAAFASTESIKYVYFERGSSVWTDLIVVDYEKALELKEDEVDDLYDAVSKGVFEALVEDKRVYLETDDGVVIDYAKAINDNKSFSEALALYNDDDEETYVTSRPKADKEMYYDDDSDEERVRFRDPDPDQDDFTPDEYPAWLIELEPEKDDQFKYHLETWEPISGTLFIEIQIDKEKFSELESTRTIYDVEIKGEEALERESEDDNVARYYIGVEEDVDPGDNAFELSTNDVKVKAGIRWYD